MVENDPDFQWSNAWWRKILLGFVGSSALALGGVAALVTGKAFAVGWTGRKRGWGFVLVEGPAAQAMAVAYLGFALAAFAYGYSRNHRVLNPYADGLLAVGLLIALAGMGQCLWLQFPW